VLQHLESEHSCLKESIIVHLYFRRKGISLPIRLGVKIDGTLIAHAWIDGLESNDFFKLNSKNENQKNKETLEFASNSEIEVQ
jgi:hypothetical protein